MQIGSSQLSGSTVLAVRIKGQQVPPETAMTFKSPLMFDSFVMKLRDQSCVAQVASPVPELNRLISIGFMVFGGVVVLLEGVLCCSGVGGATVVGVYGYKQFAGGVAHSE
ncbi:hypothetical protein Q6A51_08695 [Pseudomonas sp. KFB-139]|uniref:Uncharacterized protein n=1 Tax=Pseudomonas serbiensis TaxID=3064350 RepID=A0ABT9CQ36_9PSED|nr:hypothetical protein [Pseudomonas sp. KFB-138]MDO7926852.1 hypothetical protein [Pseudomonas sp. KFB-138]